MALKFLSKGFSYSFDEEFTACAGIGRPSNAHNEDDYDYALELMPDDEYRLVAAKNTNISDFSEVDITNINDSTSLSTFDTNTSEAYDDGAESALEDDDQIEKSTFIQSMLRLSKRQRWVEALSRRTSQAYLDENICSQEQIQEKFRQLLANGVSVRRHQSGKNAEMISLSTKSSFLGVSTSSIETPDCSSIFWEPDESPRLRSYLRSKRWGSTTEIMSGSEDIGEVTMENCVRFCGCGDGLFRGVVGHRRQDMRASTGLAESAEWNSRFNPGFKRHGSFRIVNLLYVQSANEEDPTCPGNTATANFRGSLDEYNPSLSFSVVVSCMFGTSVSTLDIECDNEEVYFSLLGGFILLRRAVAEASAEHNLCVEGQRSEIYRVLSTGIDKTFRRSPQKLLAGMKSALNSPAKQGMQWQYDKSDPIAMMFFPECDSEDEECGRAKSKRSGVRGKEILQYAEKKAHLQPPAQFLGWHSKGTQIWARLRMAGLEVKPVFSWDLRRVILKIRCPSWRLEEVAERMHVRLRLRTGGYKRFKISQRELFVHNSFDGTIFRSSERQRVIDFILRSKIKDGGAELDEDTPLGASIVQRFPLHMDSRLHDLKNSWIFFWKVEKPGEISPPWSPFSTPLSVTFRRLMNSVVYFYHGLLNQPLDQVAEYYGESVAFYFAWVAFFTRWLIVPSVLGIVVFAVQVSSRQLDHWICIPYGVFIVLWASLMLVFWRQKQSALAYRWGVLGFEMEETERPQFHGRSVFDPTTKEMRKVYSPRKRLLKYCVAVPTMLLLTFGMLLVMMVVLLSQDRLSEAYDQGEDLDFVPKPSILFLPGDYSGQNSTVTSGDPGFKLNKAISLDFEFWMTLLYYPSMYGLLVAIVSEFVDRAAFVLTNYENHRKESTYWNRLILKIFCFKFVAVFTPVYYYAVYVDDSEEAYLKMCMSIFALMTVGDWWSKFLATSIPAWIHRFKLYRMTLAVSKTNRLIWAAKWATEFAFDKTSESNSNAQRILIERREKYHAEAKSACWSEALKEDYTAIEDYTQVILQLGFVLLFGAVFPLAPIIAVINNLFFIRIDAAKLMYTRKRPIAKKIGGLGVWEDVLQIMSVIGILTNCCLLLFTSSQLKSIFYFCGTGVIALFLFAYEHIMLLFKYLLHASIDRVPLSVQRDQERNKNLIRRKRAQKTEDRNNKPHACLTHQYNSFLSVSEMCEFEASRIKQDRSNRLTPTPNIEKNLRLKSKSDEVDCKSMDGEKSQQPPSQSFYRREQFMRTNSELHSTTLASDPFEFLRSGSSASHANNMLLSGLQHQQSLGYNDPLDSVLDMSHRQMTVTQSPEMATLLSQSSSSSSEDERSVRSSRNPQPCKFNTCGGPGPVRQNSFARSLADMRSVAPSVLTRLTQHSLSTNGDEDVHTYTSELDDDEEWQIKSSTPITKLSSPRKNALLSTTEFGFDNNEKTTKNTLSRTDTHSSEVSQLTDTLSTNSCMDCFEAKVSTDNGSSSMAQNDLSKSTREGRASLLQTPFGSAPPKYSKTSPQSNPMPARAAPLLRKTPHLSPFNQSPNDLTSVTPNGNGVSPPRALPILSCGRQVMAIPDTPSPHHSPLSLPPTPPHAVLNTSPGHSPYVGLPSAPLPPKPPTPRDISPNIASATSPCKKTLSYTESENLCTPPQDTVHSNNSSPLSCDPPLSSLDTAPSLRAESPRKRPPSRRPASLLEDLVDPVNIASDSTTVGHENPVSRKRSSMWKLFRGRGNTSEAPSSPGSPSGKFSLFRGKKSVPSGPAPSTPPMNKSLPTIGDDNRPWFSKNSPSKDALSSTRKHTHQATPRSSPVPDLGYVDDNDENKNTANVHSKKLPVAKPPINLSKKTKAKKPKVVRTSLVGRGGAAYKRHLERLQSKNEKLNTPNKKAPKKKKEILDKQQASSVSTPVMNEEERRSFQKQISSWVSAVDETENLSNPFTPVLDCSSQKE